MTNMLASLPEAGAGVKSAINQFGLLVNFWSSRCSSSQRRTAASYKSFHSMADARRSAMSWRSVAISARSDAISFCSSASRSGVTWGGARRCLVDHPSEWLLEGMGSLLRFPMRVPVTQTTSGPMGKPSSRQKAAASSRLIRPISAASAVTRASRSVVRAFNRRRRRPEGVRRRGARSAAIAGSL